jgi:hypothetical protein
MVTIDHAHENISHKQLSWLSLPEKLRWDRIGPLLGLLLFWAALCTGLLRMLR